MKIDKPAHGSLAWLELRHRDEQGRVRFGASEAPVLMGVSKWTSLTDLCLNKLTTPEVTEPNAAMMRGNILEPSLIAYAGELLDERVITPDVMYSEGRLIATLDGLSESGVIVECKTTTAHSCDDELPDEYLWQVVAQFACVPEATEALVVVLDKRMRLGHWTVRRNEALVADLMLRAEEIAGWLDRRELPPDAAVSEKAAKVLYPEPEGEIELGAVGAEVIERLQHFTRLRQDAEAREQEARDELCALLGRNEVGLLDGKKVVTFKARKGSLRLDTTRLKAAYPDLVREFQVEGAGTRILRVTG